eukprot:scaffold25696_cov66-Phaeocystis_antarctica.AAC.11
MRAKWVAFRKGRIEKGESHACERQKNDKGKMENRGFDSRNSPLPQLTCREIYAPPPPGDKHACPGRVVKRDRWVARARARAARTGPRACRLARRTRSRAACTWPGARAAPRAPEATGRRPGESKGGGNQRLWAGARALPPPASLRHPRGESAPLGPGGSPRASGRASVERSKVGRWREWPRARALLTLLGRPPPH